MEQIVFWFGFAVGIIVGVFLWAGLSVGLLLWFLKKSGKSARDLMGS